MIFSTGLQVQKLTECIFTYGALDNTCCQAYERAHQEFVKDAWDHTNCKEAEEQVVLRINRERSVARLAGERARIQEQNQDFVWPEMRTTWLHDSKYQALAARREREVSNYAIFEAATLQYRKHVEAYVEVGGRARYGTARKYIPYPCLDTEGDAFVRDNPGLRYTNPSLVTFLISFYGGTLLGIDEVRHKRPFLKLNINLTLVVFCYIY